MLIQFVELIFMPAATIREKTSSVRRQHILEAAIRVFADRGFHRATIRDVAIEAGVADGTIYNVFENKTALLLGILDARPGGSAPDPAHPPTADGIDPERMIRDMIANRWAAFSPEVLTMLRVVLSEVLVNPDLRRLYVERVITPALTLPEGLMTQLSTQGKLVMADPGMTLRMMTAMFLGLVMLRLLGDERLEQEAERVPELVSALILDGMRPRLGADA